MNPTLFVSYAHGDKGEKLLNILKDELTAAQFDMVIDRQIPAGTDWRAAIDNGIRAAAAMVALIDSKSNASVYCHYEYGVAMGAKKTIIPILLEPTLEFGDIHPRLNAFQGLDFRENYQLSDLRHILKALPIPSQGVSDPDEPVYTALLDMIESTHGGVTASDLLYSLSAIQIISPAAYGKLTNALIQQQVARKR